jgi:hypothetical protein
MIYPDKSVPQREAMRRRKRPAWLYIGGVLLLNGTIGRHVDAFLTIPLLLVGDQQHGNRKHFHYAESWKSDQQQVITSTILSAPILSDHAPSWETLQQLALKTATGSRLEKERTEREMGLGPPHTDSLLRLFQSEEPSSSSLCKDVRVTLYRDHAGRYAKP